MFFRGLVFPLAFSAILGTITACQGQTPHSNLGLITLFDDRPFHFDCADRPRTPPPGTHSWVTFSPQAPYARTRLDTLDLPRSVVPALTVVSEYLNWIQIAGVQQDHWSLHYCAIGEGNTPEEAASYLPKISMQRTGSLLSLGETNSLGLTGGHANFLLEAPADAPLTVHGYAAVEVHDMTGPLRVSALGRAVILNTTGRVDVFAQMIDFAGSQGKVTLEAPWNIQIKINAIEFLGTVTANAQKEINAFFPPSSQTPVNVVVDRPKDFICRADFCSKMKKDRINSLYRFTYGDAESARDGISLRSEGSTVMIGNLP